MFVCQINAPFKPEIKGETDVSYFDTDFTSEEPGLTPPDEGEWLYCALSYQFSCSSVVALNMFSGCVVA